MFWTRLTLDGIAVGHSGAEVMCCFISCNGEMMSLINHCQLESPTRLLHL